MNSLLELFGTLLYNFLNKRHNSPNIANDNYNCYAKELNSGNK